PSRPDRPPHWRTDAETHAYSSETEGAPRPYTTYGGLLKQPDNHEVAKLALRDLSSLTQVGDDMGKRFVTIAVMGLMLGSAPGTSAQRPLTIRLGVHGAVQGAPDVIAIRQGYFKQKHLEVDWRRFGVGREGRDAMIAGAIDINATATTPFLIGLEKGVPYTAVAVSC